MELDGVWLSYAQLMARAGRLATELRERGVGPDVRVGICLPRSFAMAEAVLAVLQAGGAYVPLDPSYPPERLDFMLRDCGARLVVTRPELRPLLPAGAAELLLLDDAGPAPAAGAPSAPPLPGTDARHLGYVIYTSGSTGRPKGVAMPLGPLENLIHWQLSDSRTGAGRTLQFAPLSFDVHFQELFATWCAGGTVVLLREESRRDPAALLRLIRDARIERLFLPFVALQALCEAAAARGWWPTRLREVMTAGEQLRITPQIARFFDALPDCVLFNQYGPSETHVVSSHRLTGPAGAWPALPPIGTAIPRARLEVVDEELRPVPAGTEGELLIGGECVARGYLNDPDQTERRFLPDPSQSGHRYRTGDRVREHPPGTFHFLGRADAQVKIRGIRVEPGEVEVVLSQHPAVRQVAVIARESAAGAKTLVAYAVVDGGADWIADLRRHAAERLPPHMVPSAFVPLAELPRTPSGKVDRARLPAPTAAEVGHVEPRTGTERELAGIWASVLGVERVGAHDDFLELGGHSLAGMLVLTRILERWRVELSLSDLLDGRTVEGCAAAIDERLAGVGQGGALQPILEAFWVELLGVEDVPAGDRCWRSGVAEARAADFSAQVQEYFGVHLDPTVVRGLRGFDELSRLVLEALGGERAEQLGRRYAAALQGG